MGAEVPGSQRKLIDSTATAEPVTASQVAGCKPHALLAIHKTNHILTIHKINHSPEVGKEGPGMSHPVTLACSL